MDLFSKRNIKSLFKKYQSKPLKKFGQNFLIDRSAAKKVIEMANLKPSDTVLEIGPGIGTLTVELAKKAKQVIAIEKDPKMVEILKETLKDFQNVEVIYGDILKLGPKPHTLNPYKIVANLPFYLSVPVIRQFLETKKPPKEMVLIVQKEVGQRICAKPPDMSILAVSVQLYAQPKIINYVSKKSFWPQPKVDSAIIKIIPKTQNLPRPVLGRFFRIVKAGFAQPRKQLINNLSNGLKIDKKKVRDWLLKNKILPSQRAETLSIENWIKLTMSCKSLIVIINCFCAIIN